MLHPLRRRTATSFRVFAICINYIRKILAHRRHLHKFGTNTERDRYLPFFPGLPAASVMLIDLPQRVLTEEGYCARAPIGNLCKSSKGNQWNRWKRGKWIYWSRLGLKRERKALRLYGLSPGLANQDWSGFTNCCHNWVTWIEETEHVRRVLFRAKYWLQNGYSSSGEWWKSALKCTQKPKAQNEIHSILRLCKT